jgi:SAM-dependent methyltransferase
MYADNFGFQWNTFAQIQLDSYNKSRFSEERLQRITGWELQDVHGKRVLDAGCGAGRFAEVMIRKYGAELVAIDLSQAVEAFHRNLQRYPHIVCQASVYELPFKPESFDLVYSIGVVQHTPDPYRAIRCLCRRVKPGGQIALWMYELNWKCFVGTAGFKYAFRPLVKRLPRRAQIRFCDFLMTLFSPVVLRVKNLGLVGKLVMRMLPVASAHLQHVPLSDRDFRSWVWLDTFDMYTPTYDSPLRYSAIARVLREEGFGDIRRQSEGAIAITGVRTRGRS